jgi:serine/threonine-protein kinase
MMGKSLWNRLFSWRLSAAESRRFGRYHIVRIVHDGEKACVYEARQPGSEESVAIKAYKSLYNRTARRMRKRYSLRTEGEIGRILAPADAPEEFPIVRTLGEGWEFGDRAKCYYIVMEYVEGLNLKHLIGCGDKWLRGNRLHVATMVARALVAVHERNFVHRDVCTDNVIVRKDGRVKLIDLGFVAPSGISFEEKSGTPSYMAPEQFEGKPLTAATDVYSFGVVLYELFTGRLPFTSQYSGKDPMMIARRTSDLRFKHLRDAPVPPRELVPEMPEQLNDLVLRCLEKAPEGRFPGMKQLCGELSHLDQRSSGVQDEPPE